MTTQINQDNMTSATIALLSGPRITNLQITNSSYVVLDDTAVSTSGGYIKITGTNFVSGAQVYIGSTLATSVTFVNSTTINAQVGAASAGTYLVYVVNPDSGTAILINGLTYSGTPTWVTGSTLPTGQVNAAISIQLSATGDAPLTYALQAGSSLPAGLTLTSGGLLSGTITGITSETTYNFTIEAIDAESQESPRAFSITITASDQYFSYVNLLLSASSVSSTFVSDASTNQFTITVTGDTRSNNFGPYTPGYYSNYFDGTGDWLTFTGATTGSGNFTTEAWVYLATLKDYQLIFDNRATGASATGYAFGVDAAGKPYMYTNNAFQILSSIVITANTWNHVALVRSGTTITLYVNGVSGGSYTSSANFSDTNNGIGVAPTFTTTSQYFGYISNLRVVNGTAVYTTTFTPPTSPLTAISGTSLLTCQSNRFIDTSTNNFAITVSGNTSINGFDPFVPASNTATFGSGYFDGTGDYLDVASNIAFNFGTGNFTIEFWAYFTTISGSTPNLVDMRSGGNPQTALTLYLNGGTLTLYVAGANRITGSVMSANIWYHIALVRNTGSTVLYVNGIQSGATYSDSNNYGTQPIRIFASNDGGAVVAQAGYCSNFRVVKGTAVYTTTFTPPTSPLTAISGTSLLTLQSNQPTNNNMFVDNSTNNLLITRNGNTTQGSFSPYAGTWSNYFDGSTGYLTAGTTASNFLCTGSATGITATFEAWVYLTAYNTGANPWVFSPIHAKGNTYINFGVRNGAVRFYWYDGATKNVDSASTSDVPLNTWTHIAVTINGTTIRIYVNGVLNTTSATFTGVQAAGVNQTEYIGWAGTSTTFFTGYISNYRLTNTIVYSSAFTSPTQPLFAISGTSLLTCADNRLIDDSPNNFALTRNGDVSVQKFSPFTLQTQIVPTSYSVFFDGSGDYLDVTNSSTCSNFGTSDFTLEGWFYFQNVSVQSLLLDFRTGPSDVAGALFYSGTNISWYVSGATRIAGGALLAGQWYHIALSRAGTSTKLFVNGTQVGSTYTDSNNYVGNTNRPRISELGDGTGNFPFNGNISNLRIVKGTAVYTANFTPPTAPLTAITNTSLLTCQSTAIIDNSSNAFTIIVNGNSRPLAQNPFGYTNPTQGPYTVSALGGGMYFDGTGDYLIVPSNPPTYLSNRPFTIEAWVYLNANNGIIVSRRASVAARGFFLSYGNVTNNKFSFNAGDTEVTNWNVQLTSTDTFSLSQWHHVAITRNSSNLFTLWVNGVSQASSTASFTIADDTSNLQIGTIDSGGSLFNGYIADLRIIPGQAQYASPFVPPIAPLTAIQNSVLLLNGTSAGVTDSSMIANYETVGGAIVTTSTEYYGSNSVFFNGTNSGLFSASSVQHSFGSGNFTIEFWYYPTSTAGTNPNIMCNNNAGSFVSGLWSFHAPHSSYPNKYSLWVASFNTGAAILVSTSNIAINTWTFVTITRTTNTWRMFINGTIEATATHSGVFDNGGSYPQFIGYQPGVESGRYITGYMCDIRFTKGVSRYAANFTPPTTPFIQY